MKASAILNLLNWMKASASIVSESAPTPHTETGYTSVPLIARFLLQRGTYFENCFVAEEVRTWQSAQDGVAPNHLHALLAKETGSQYVEGYRFDDRTGDIVFCSWCCDKTNPSVVSMAMDLEVHDLCSHYGYIGVTYTDALVEAARKKIKKGCDLWLYPQVIERLANSEPPERLIIDR